MAPSEGQLLDEMSRRLDNTLTVSPLIASYNTYSNNFTGRNTIVQSVLLLNVKKKVGRCHTLILPQIKSNLRRHNILLMTQKNPSKNKGLYVLLLYVMLIRNALQAAYEEHYPH